MNKFSTFSALIPIKIVSPQRFKTHCGAQTTRHSSAQTPTTAETHSLIGMGKGSGPYTRRRDSEYDGEDDNLNVNW